MIYRSIFFMMFMATSSFGQQAEDCELRKESDGIKVYVCKSGDEKFKTLRAEFILENISMDQLIKFLFKVENYPEWQYNMVDAELLNKISDDEMMYRSEIDAPWPVEDRELFNNFKVIRDAGPERISIIISNIPSDRPLQSNLIRVPFFSAIYHITEVNKSELKVIYNLRIDPGGSVPAWLVNIAMAEGPYESFRNLKKRISMVDKTN